MHETRPVIALTGGTGFVGAHVVACLAAAGWRPRLLTRRLPINPFLRDICVDTVIGDIHDAQALRELVTGAHAVIHAAGVVKAVAPEHFFAVNRDGTIALSTALQRHNPQAGLILISSLAAREPLLSPYAASKRAAEEYLRQHASFPWLALRPPAIYGPGDTEMLPLFRAMAKGICVRIGRKDARLSFLHVMDFAQAVTQAIDHLSSLSGVSHEIDDGAASGHDWSDIVAAGRLACARRVTLIGFPDPLLWLLALLSGVQARLTRRAAMLNLGKLREIRHPDWVVAPGRFGAVTGWRAQFDLSTGFAQTVAFYRKSGLL